MKKFLALVLALVMTMSLVTISAGAEDFTDADDVTYAEAVDVMTAIGVVGGYADGSFNPTAGLTRGAAAKIICNMLLGPTTADALVANEAPFSDVAVDNVFAGYIAYCVNEGIISGYADGTFKPAAPLTGYAFMKMLLGALGYDPAIEGYTGTNWSIQVAKRALAIGLDDGLVGDFSGAKALTREEACLYAFNTLLATMVEYENDSTISVGDITISSNAKAEEVTATAAAVPNNFKTAEVDAGKHTVQFAEKFFSKLTSYTAFAEGRTGRVMQYKGKDVSDFAATDTVLATVSAGNTIAELTTKTSKYYVGYEPNVGAEYIWNDGVAVAGTTTAGTGWPTVSTGSAISLATQNAAVETSLDKDGVIVNFLDTNSDGKYEYISVVEKTVDKVTGNVRTSVSGAVTKVTIPGLGVSDVDVDDIVYPELVKDDVVLMYDSANGVTYIEKAEFVNGTMTAYDATNAYVDGAKTNVSALSGANTLEELKTATKSKADTTFYLDNNGNIVAYKLADSAVTLENTLFVRDAVKPGYVAEAQVLFMDGTTATVKVDKTATYNGSLKAVSAVSGPMADGVLLANQYYTYTVNAAGNYELVACQYQAAKTAATLAKGVAALTTGAGDKYATNETAFVLEKEGTWTVKAGVADTYASADSFAVYTGVANVPAYGASSTTDADPSATLTSGVAVYVLYTATGYATAVVGIDGAMNTASVTDYDVVFATGDEVTVYKADGSVDYFTYDAIVNGEFVEGFKVATTGFLTRGQAALVNGYDGDKANAVQGSATSPVDMRPATVANATNDVVEVAVSGNTVLAKQADGTVVGSFAVTDDAVMVVYNYADKSYSIDTVDGLFAATGNEYTIYTVAASTTDSSVEYVFVVNAAAV